MHERAGEIDVVRRQQQRRHEQRCGRTPDPACKPESEGDRGARQHTGCDEPGTGHTEEGNRRAEHDRAAVPVPEVVVRPGQPVSVCPATDLRYGRLATPERRTPDRRLEVVHPGWRTETDRHPLALAVSVDRAARVSDAVGIVVELPLEDLRVHLRHHQPVRDEVGGHHEQQCESREGDQYGDAPHESPPVDHRRQSVTGTEVVTRPRSRHG